MIRNYAIIFIVFALPFVGEFELVAIRAEEAANAREVALWDAVQAACNEARDATAAGRATVELRERESGNLSNPKFRVSRFTSEWDRSKYRYDCVYGKIDTWNEEPGSMSSVSFISDGTTSFAYWPDLRHCAIESPPMSTTHQLLIHGMPRAAWIGKPPSHAEYLGTYRDRLLSVRDQLTYDFGGRENSITYASGDIVLKQSFDAEHHLMTQHLLIAKDACHAQRIVWSRNEKGTSFPSEVYYRAGGDRVPSGPEDADLIVHVSDVELDYRPKPERFRFDRATLPPGTRIAESIGGRRREYVLGNDDALLSAAEIARMAGEKMRTEGFSSPNP